jgi:putative ABC transport system permease protein
MSLAQPPRLAERLLASRVRPEERPMVLGDLAEQFHRRCRERGPLRAATWYWSAALGLSWGLWWWMPNRTRPRARTMTMDDVKYAWRRLWKQRTASVVSIVTLAFAIGAASAAWSLISAVLLHPVQVPEPERVMQIGYRRDTPRGPQDTSGFTYPAAELVRGANVLPLAAWGSINPRKALLIDVNGEAKTRGVRFTTPNFLEVLGLRPQLGRYFSEAEDRGDAPLVAVISDRFWRREFGADSAVLNKVIRVRDEPARIVGVLPRGFRGLDVSRAPDLFLPLRVMDRVTLVENLYSDRPPLYWTHLVGRLPDGVTASQMQERLKSLTFESVGSLKGTTLVLTDIETASLSASSRADLRQFARLLGSTVALLLGIGSLTVAMLLLMRTEARGVEFAMCLALGAPRRRLAMGVVIEGAVLAVIGAALALPVSRVMFLGISGFELPGDIRVEVLDLTLDRRVLMAASMAAVLSIILVAAVAGTFGLRQNLGDVLRSHTGATPRLVRRRSRAALVTAQVAVTLVLVTGAGLFARSIGRALSLNPSFDTTRVLWGDAGVTDYGADPQRQLAFLRDFEARLSQQPSVASFGFSRSNQGIGVVRIDGEERKVSSQSSYGWSGVYIVGIDPRYLPTLELAVSAGRAFTDADRAGAPTVAIVSSSLARAIAADGRAVGHRIGPPSANPLFAEAEIVGVVPDIVRGPRGLKPQALYLPSAQYAPPVYPGSGGPGLVVRAARDAKSAERAVAETIRSLDPTIYPAPMTTIDAGILQDMAPQRFGMTVMSALGTIALLLSVLGTYVLSESAAALRRREMGIRAALGASGRRLGAILLTDTVRLVGIGLVIGFGVSWLGAGMIRSFLFQVEPLDPLVTGAVAGTIIALALLVSLRPAIATARVDLARVLRDD